MITSFLIGDHAPTQQQGTHNSYWREQRLIELQSYFVFARSRFQISNRTLAVRITLRTLLFLLLIPDNYSDEARNASLI